MFFVLIFVNQVKSQSSTTSFVSLTCPEFTQVQNVTLYGTVIENDSAYSCSNLVNMQVVYPNSTTVTLSPSACDSISGVRTYPSFLTNLGGNYNASISLLGQTASCTITRVVYTRPNTIPEWNFWVLVLFTIISLGWAKKINKKDGLEKN